MAVLICALCFDTKAYAAEAAYWQCGLDRITIVSNSSAARCERLARSVIRYEQMLTQLVGWEPDTSVPPLTLYSLSRADARNVMLTQSEREEQKRTRRAIYSKYLPGEEFNIAAIMDIGGDEPLQAVLFMYGQQLLAYGPTRSYPAWFQLGVANLLNGATVRPDGSLWLHRQKTFAAVVEDNQRASARLNLASLLDASLRDLTPADFNELAQRAHVWAQFGLLTTAERRTQYRDLALAMRQGEPAEEAVPAAFGASLAALTTEFESGAWRKDATYRHPAPAVVPTIPAPASVDTSKLDELFQAIADRVAENEQ